MSLYYSLNHASFADTSNAPFAPLVFTLYDHNLAEIKINHPKAYIDFLVETLVKFQCCKSRNYLVGLKESESDDDKFMEVDEGIKLLKANPTLKIKVKVEDANITTLLTEPQEISFEQFSAIKAVLPKADITNFGIEEEFDLMLSGVERPLNGKLIHASLIKTLMNRIDEKYQKPISINKKGELVLFGEMIASPDRIKGLTIDSKKALPLFKLINVMPLSVNMAMHQVCDELSQTSPKFIGLDTVKTQLNLLPRRHFKELCDFTDCEYDEDLYETIYTEMQILGFNHVQKELIYSPLTEIHDWFMKHMAKRIQHYNEVNDYYPLDKSLVTMETYLFNND